MFTTYVAGVLGAVLAVSRALVPDEYQLVEPVRYMTEVVSHLHYCPDSWKGKFHTVQVCE